MANAAQDRRYEAIRTVSGAHLQAVELPMGDAAVCALLQDILALKALGRTDRWKDAVQRWAELITETPENRRWALIQGSIWAAHQA
jgi:hypothetical protein